MLLATIRTLFPGVRGRIRNAEERYILPVLVLYGYSSTPPPQTCGPNRASQRPRPTSLQRRATSWVACVRAPPRRFRQSPAGTPRWPRRAAALRQNAGLHQLRRPVRRAAVTAPASCSITTEVAPAGCGRPDRHALRAREHGRTDRHGAALHSTYPRRWPGFGPGHLGPGERGWVGARESFGQAWQARLRLAAEGGAALHERRFCGSSSSSMVRAAGSPIEQHLGKRG